MYHFSCSETLPAKAFAVLLFEPHSAGHLLKVLNEFPCTVWNIQLQIYQARTQISPLLLASCGAVHSSSKWPEGRRHQSDHQRQQAGCRLGAPCPHQLLQAVHRPQVGAGLGAGTGVVTRAKALGRLVLSPKKSGRALVGHHCMLALRSPLPARNGPAAGWGELGAAVSSLEEQLAAM